MVATARRAGQSGVDTGRLASLLNSAAREADSAANGLSQYADGAQAFAGRLAFAHFARGARGNAAAIITSAMLSGVSTAGGLSTPLTGAVDAHFGNHDAAIAQMEASRPGVGDMDRSDHRDDHLSRPVAAPTMGQHPPKKK
ncbi:hypothetical protein ACFQNE_05730 [Gordonia phosphorivorans]|uniref:ESX-1 secretion-associated protein n=1 Tax=Gordonia phosphorivorans TaxID=1056982 RepID=A0ABV6H6W0_9ACTN